MSANKYRFVSPGIFLTEIDQSQLPRQAAEVGPAVIGRTQRGPAMRPVTVNSFLDFVELFGNPIPGGEGGDVWREGNRTSPTYASYAARAWLKSGSPLTVVRVLGETRTGASAGNGEAGWKTANTPNSDLTANGGAFGLFVDAVVVVDCAPEQQVARFVERTGATAEEARRRMGSQMNRAARNRRADFVLSNEGSLQELEEAVELLLPKLLTIGGKDGC